MILQSDRSISFERLFGRLVRNIKGLRWLVNLFSSHPELYTDYETDPAMISFRDAIRVNLYIQQAEPEVIPMLEQLGSMMNLERPDVVPIRKEASVLPTRDLMFVSSEKKTHVVKNAEYNNIASNTINVTIETEDGFKRILNVREDDPGTPMTFYYARPQPPKPV